MFQEYNAIDPTLVANSPSATGIVADGVSAALVVLKSNSNSPVTFTLSTPGYLVPEATISTYDPNYLKTQQTGSTEPLTLQAPTFSCAPPTETCTYFALMGPSQMPYSLQPLTIQVTASQAASGNKPAASTTGALLLEAPPLVLVHGLWSSAATWSSFINWLPGNYPQNIVVAANYQAFNTLDFRNEGTQQILATAVANALDTAATNGIVASKVDVFAHSMGGLVTRYFMTNGPPPPFSSQYLPENPIHSLVTVGTPQDGSPFANFLELNQKANPAILPPPYSFLCTVTNSCTLGSVLAMSGRPIGTAALSLETGLPSSSKPYRSIVGIAPDPSPSGLALNAVINAFVPGSFLDGILGTPNDTIVPAANENIGAIDSATVQGVVHASLTGNILDTDETHSQDVWDQATFWLLGGTGTFGASSAAIYSQQKKTSPMVSAPSDTPSPVFDLTGYTQVDASNVSFSPASGTALTIESATTIAATSTTKTISELLVYQIVSDPTDIPISYATQSPFNIAFTPTRLGKANFVAFTVFTDNTFASVQLSYPLQPSGNALALSLNAPAASLPVGLSTIVSAQALFANGPVDVTQQATYVARSGGTSVFSVGTNGSITTTGNGTDWLDVSYGGQTASAQITVGLCTYSLNPVNQYLDVSGGTVTIQVTTGSGCPWTADLGGSTWLSSTNLSASGSASISLCGSEHDWSISPAIVTVANQEAAITQPVKSWTFSLNESPISAPATGTSGSICTASCPIVAGSSANWVTVIPLSSSVAYTVAGKPDHFTKVSNHHDRKQAVTVNQAAAAAHTTVLTAQPNTAALNGTTTLTAMVTSQAAGTITGQVTFMVGAHTVLGTARSPVELRS